MESAAQALLSLAALAPGLSEAELRVCIYLASIQDPHHHSAQASSRQITEATRLARANVQRAIDSLTRRCLIATRQGGGQRASTYLLNFTQTAALSTGLTARPLPQATLDLQPQEVASYQGHQSGPQPPLDIDVNPDSILDRVLTARPQHFQAGQLDQVRRYAYKWLLLQKGQSNAPPPDPLLCAQILTAAGSAIAACNFIVDHLQDRQAENCQYLVSWLLQKKHGIAPPTVKRRRAQLRLVGKGYTDFAADLVTEAAAGVKKLR